MAKWLEPINLKKPDGALYLPEFVLAGLTPNL
jgi:hypothetical protein